MDVAGVLLTFAITPYTALANFWAGSFEGQILHVQQCLAEPLDARSNASTGYQYSARESRILSN